MMVANTIDEPNGGIQGIKRAKGEGKNPKTYGQTNAAKGFIPNYAVGAAVGGARLLTGLLPALRTFGDDLLKLGSKSSKAGKSLDNLGDAAKQTKFGKTKEVAGGFLKDTFSGLTSLSLFSLIPQIDFSLEGFKKIVVDISGNASGLSDEMKEERALRQSFISDLEKEKSKDKPDESRVKDLEGLVKGSEEYSARLEKSSQDAALGASLFLEEMTGMLSFLNGIGVFNEKDMAKYGQKGEDLESESTMRKILQPFLTMSGGDYLRGKLYETVGSRFEDSGAGGQYYNTGMRTEIEDRAKDGRDKNMRDNDAIGDFMTRGYSVPKKDEEGERDFSSREPEKLFFANLIEDKENNLNIQRNRTSNELVNARAEVPSRRSRKEVDRLTSKLEKLDSQLESLDFEDFVDNFEKGLKARQDGESPLAKALREAGGEGLSSREYGRATESNIEYLEQQVRVKLEAAEVRKEIDRVKDLFEKETFSFKFDVKNVRSQLERIVDDVAIGGRKASVERAGNATELQKRAIRSSNSKFESDPTVTSRQRIDNEGRINDESSRLDDLQFKRRDELIGQTSSDKFGDLFTQLSGNLNSSGSGASLLEREKAAAALSSAKVNLAGASPENQEEAQQRVDQLTSNLSEIDSKIASRPASAADLSQEGEVQRLKLQKIQDAAKTLTTGDLGEESQKKALEDFFENLEDLNLGDAGAEIKQEILDAAKEVSAERTALFVEQEKTRLNNELEALEKQKSILNEFVSKFNSSFRENIEGTRNTFNTLSKNQTPVAQNAAALTAARIGTGETSDAQIISDRLNASNRVTQVFDDANFSNLVSPEDLATFRSQTTSQIVSGGDLTALEDINEKAAQNLSSSISGGGFNQEEISAITQVAKGSLGQVSSDIYAAAQGPDGDPFLAARAQELQDLLADPEASIGEILSAVESLNIDESGLSEEVQTALQENIARALGAIGGIKSSVEGRDAVDQSDDVSSKIETFSRSLSLLIEGIDSNIPEVKFPEIVATLEQNTDLLQTAMGGLTTQFDKLDGVSRGLETSLEAFKTTVDNFKTSETNQTGQNTEALQAMQKALEAVEAATRKLKPDNTKAQ
jgi:hypothetical protein